MLHRTMAFTTEVELGHDGAHRGAAEITHVGKFAHFAEEAFGLHEGDGLVVGPSGGGG